MGSFMKPLFGHLGLGALILGAASAGLLAWDYSLRQDRRHSLPRVAILQHTSLPALDEGVRGYVDGLAQRGYVDGRTVQIRYFNAEGDVATANTMASAIVGGGFALVLTCTTPSLQAVANANRDGRVNHVFGVVNDPFSAGVGLDRDRPLVHPPHLVGQGIFPPVLDAFRLARKLYPGLRKVGLIWNPAESNSRAVTLRAREIAGRMGIDLVESAVENVTGVPEACQSVISRGAQAIWISADMTVYSAAGVVMGAARKAGIPVFSMVPAEPDRGTLFEIGVDYHEVGKQAGLLAADVLAGTDPRTIPIRDVLDVVPKQLTVNLRALKGLRDAWTVPEAVRRQAATLVDERGIHKQPRP
jgi:putative ABC transport system substrate-binding protein